jgi:hypothetical protein
VTEQQQHGLAHHDFGSMIALWEEKKRARLTRAVDNRQRTGRYTSILDGKIDRCEPRKQLDDYPTRTSFEETDYFRVYETREPKAFEWIGITVQPTIGAEEDLDDDRLPNPVDPDRD